MTSPRTLRSAEELEAAFAASADQPVWIFKHSLVCPVSTAALREYQRHVAAEENGSRALFTLIEIQNHRDLSDRVAKQTGVRHESPQALLLRGGEVDWHDSHWRITAASLAEALSGES